MPDQTTVRLPDGVRLHVRASGPTDAPVTLIMLHGWTLDGRTWRRQIDALTAGSAGPVRMVTYDARGHGRSSSTRLRSATLAQLGDDLAEIVREVAPTGPVVLAGHSMGGMTIMEYAHRHPDEFAARVAGLVFVATTAEGHTHTVYGLSPRVTRLIRLAETTGAGLLARCGEWHPHRPLLRALRPTLRWLLFGDSCDPDAIRLTTSAVARASLRSIGGFRPSIGAQQRLETLAALGDVPAAALVGDRDRLTPPPCAESIAAALPGTELTVCPGAGHMLMLERPDEVTAALAAVLRRVAPEQTGSAELPLAA
ncbi:Pimeloyl-ACP methyl ester carboxylesterase [Micromonospora pattaloongensis]|uniref:Pimeloyl-ACP methyl ester carboxylesterase n=1 Tax=Micromonospora pattaloongensis TaxID=405436 RepID=A0A1H3SQK0_9ACTN|nr:alpha/beta hydrolase [Micromonospora pattaloongensis]SDZ40224.1 Pimeloyl-ACP methyl ester carboxylesterase [Micromonospora pattaloongensis]